MKVDICRRCHRRNTDKPRTAMCPNTRAHHVWVSVSSAVGMRIANKQRLAQATAASEPAESDEDES